MIYIRKITAIVLILAVFFAFSLSCAFADDSATAQSTTIYETSKTQTITSGVTLETKDRYTDNGWLTINVLRVDLTNPYVSVDSLFNSDSLSNLTTVKSLAQTSGALAAVNGSFFVWDSAPGKGNSVGPIVKSGQIVSAPADINSTSDTFATFSLNNLNQTSLDFWKINIQLTAPTGNSVQVGRYNKKYNGHLDYTILDGKMTKTTIGTTYGSSDCVEMLVSNGKVVEIRQAMPATQMPDNGYIVVTRKVGGQFLLDNFKVGDDVTLNITSNPDWSNLKFAISGDAALVKNGVIPDTFSHVPEGSPGKNPRTAIGSTQDGTQLLMVTVDGKENSSSGVTQKDLALIMQELGAYNALNLDGGGSTTMVARPEGSSDLSVINTPSDGSQRKISTAVGVFSVAPTTSLNGLIINTDDNNVFVNTSRAFSVKGYDSFFNPVSVDPATVSWSVSGISGTFVGNVFHPTSVGTGVITATVGNVTQQMTVYSLSSPIELKLSDSILNLSVKNTKTFSIKGKNLNGYYAVINPQDVIWTVKGDSGTFSNGVFTAVKPGAGYIDAQVGNTHAYCSISVKQDGSVIKNDFESNNGTILPYPNIVSGTYSISNEQIHSGSYSGKLTYDFPLSNDKRAAYIVFQNNGIPLDATTTKLGIWVYNDHQNPDWLGAQVYDAAGKLNYVYFTQGMDWTGWKYLEVPLDGITSPARLARIYLLLSDPVPDSGSIYLDDLTATLSGYPTANAVIPSNTVPVDSANKSLVFKKGPNSFRFSVFGQSSEPRNPLEKLLLTKFTSKINSAIDFATVVGSSKHSFISSVKKPILSTGKGYTSMDYSNSRFIQLDMSNGGLRKTDTAQWHWLLQQLDSAPGSNVFLLLANSPQNFSDSLEADLFQNVLTQFKGASHKNVWVFYNGSANTSYMEKGIKYITTSGFDVKGLKPNTTSLAKYALVTVNGNIITYEFKPVN